MGRLLQTLHHEAAPGALTPSTDQLAEYVGTFVSEESGATYRTAVQNGQLIFMVDYFPGTAIMLVPADLDEFQTPSRRYRFRRDGDGSVCAVSLANYKVGGQEALLAPRSVKP
jgi:hypothetical protein